jgi:diaminohydroxyphosphoribosylaminopyrimidine deaminase/5-amino-6-(5-phosphoribosylamino)uracil reductase
MEPTTQTEQVGDEETRDRDARLMRLALREAERALWRTHPNPMVGAVVVRDGEVLATGYHAQAGSAHAEVDALRKLGMQAEGAEVFVTLEPCHHYGRTGPCTKALIEAKIRRCIVGVIDPDPRVSGQGVAALRAAGIECVVGVEEAACRALNLPFFTRVQQQRPYVTAKVAMTLDGRIATRTGHSRWVTGEASRAAVHEMRAVHDAVLVGTETVVLDDPALTVRTPHYEGRQPLRVVLDRTLRVPTSHQVFDASSAKTLLVVAEGSLVAAKTKHPHIDILEVPVVADRLDLHALMRALAAADITTVLCEGGGGLLAGLLRAELVDKYVAFVAPKIIGGAAAPGPVGGEGAALMGDALPFAWVSAERVGEDLRLDAVPLAKRHLADMGEGR